MDEKIAKLLRSAFDTYLEEVGIYTRGIGPYLPYDFDFIHDHDWYALGELMVEDELQELTNIMNRWHRDLGRWKSWNNVLNGYNEIEALEIHREFVESLAHQCLVEPSSLRDRLTFTATNAFHQVRLSIENEYKDCLEGDQDRPDTKPNYLTRKKREKQLSKIISKWPESEKFLRLLKRINCKSYRKKTYDYRNRVNHSTAPRLRLGITQFITRRLIQEERLIPQPDGTYKLLPIDGKLSVNYSFGGTPPINLEEAWNLNMEQYRLSRKCYKEYVNLLKSKTKLLKLKKRPLTI